MKLSRFWIAITASVVIRYPVVLFLHSAFFLQGKKVVQEWQMLCSWDCPNYAALTSHLEPSAFFPGLPLVSKIPFLLGMSSTASVLLTSIVFSIAAGVMSLFFAEEWNRRFLSSNTEKSAGFSIFAWVFFLLVTLFPHSQFWMRGYSEPLFWFFTISWGYFRLLDRQGTALLFLSLLPLTRPQGIWIFGLIGAFELIQARQWKRLVPTGIPLFAFLVWNWIERGSVLYFLQVQVKGWQRGFDWRRGIDAHLPRGIDASLFLYLGLAAGFYFFRKRRQSNVYGYLALGTWIFTEFPLWFGGLYSYNRFSSIHVGLFLFLAEILVHRRAWLALWILWSFSRLSMLTYRVGFGQWVESQGVPETELDWLKPPHEKLSYLLSPEVLKRAQEEALKKSVSPTAAP